MTYMTSDEVASFIRVKPETLRYWRHVRQGPPFFKLGRKVLYAREDVERYMEDVRTRGTMNR